MSGNQAAESPTPPQGTSNGKTPTRGRKAAAQAPAPKTTIAARAKTTPPAPAKQPVQASPATPSKVAIAAHPLIQGLIETFPPDGTRWPIDDAKAWLDTAAAALKLICKFPGTLVVTATPAA
jgi:hypothetical protein